MGTELAFRFRLGLEFGDRVGLQVQVRVAGFWVLVMGTELNKDKNIHSVNEASEFAGNLYMRHPRKLQDGGRYHVVARANRKEMILHSNAMKDLFLQTVVRAKEKYDFRVDNFVVMGNHFHMIITPLEGANLSRIMQWIMSVFAMKYNRIHNQTGHVWGGRFFSHLLGSFWQYLQAFLYIDENPVRACQVKKAGDWSHGGIVHRKHGIRYLVEKLPAWLEPFCKAHKELLLT